MAKLEWHKRARIETNDTARRRILAERSGLYRIVVSRSLYGLPTIVYAQRAVRLACCRWEIISKHRRAKRAVAACEADSHRRGALA